MNLDFLKIYYKWKMSFEQDTQKHMQNFSKVAKLAFHFFTTLSIKSLLFIKAVILFLVGLWWFWVLLGIAFLIAFIVFMLLTLLYHTQLMPIMAIKVKIQDHGLQNYVYSSDLGDIKGSMTNDNWDIKSFDEEFKRNLLREIKSSLIAQQDSKNMVGVLSQGVAMTLWQVLMSKTEENNKYAQGLIHALNGCVNDFAKNENEKELFECLYNKNAKKAISKQAVLSRNAVMKQAEVNVYSLIQLKGIGLAYVKDFSNFCSAAGNVIQQAENGKPLDAYDVEKINTYLNTPYMLGRDTLLGTINAGSRNAKLGHANPLFFLPELSVTANIFERYNQSTISSLGLTTKMFKNSEAFFPTLSNFIALIIKENIFASRLGESYFLPTPNSPDSFIAYKNKSDKDKKYSVELTFNPGEKFSEQSLFKKNIFNTKEEVEKAAKELTPELKNLKTFYETSCSATHQEDFVRMNFISTNGFALNRQGYLKTFGLGGNEKTYFKTYKEILAKKIWGYSRWATGNSDPHKAYEFFNSTINERLTYANNDNAINQESPYLIKGINHQADMFFFNNFFFNNITLNNTDNLKSVAQLTTAAEKEKINQLTEQFNYLGDVKEYDQIVSKLHDMYVLKGAISGKYYVMDFSPLENVYKADPVYWHLTVMNPFPAYSATYDILDSTINNQDFFNKVNGTAINRSTDFYNVPYVNIDITDVALELWYDGASPILVKYYLYWLDKNSDQYNTLLRKSANIKLKHNPKAKKLPEYFISQTEDVDGYKAFLRSNPFLYSQSLDTQADQTFYLGLWYQQISGDLNTWLNTFKATARAFWDNEQLRSKFKIGTNQDKVDQSAKVAKLNPKFKENIWATKATLKNNYEYEQFYGNYDAQPKKISVCINAPISVQQNMPVINMNLYQLLQNKEFNFSVPTTYTLNKMYKVCMDIDNVYVKNETYLNYLKGNRQLNEDFKILGKGNIVFTSLYLKDYVPENISTLMGQQNIYSLRENALLRQLEKKTTKLLDFEVSKSAKDMKMPFCQMKLKPTIVQMKTKGNSIVNQTSLNPLTSSFSIQGLNNKFNQNFSSLIKTNNVLDNYTPTPSSTFSETIEDSQLLEEYTSGRILRDWTKGYKANTIVPLFKKYSKQASSIKNIFNQSSNSLNGWGMQERLWEVFWDAENNQYKISRFQFFCKDQNGVEHVEVTSEIGNHLYDQSRLLKNTHYFEGEERASLESGTKKYSIDYGEYFYNPNITYLPIPEVQDSKEYKDFMRSQLFYQVYVWDSKVKALRDELVKYKNIERFIHLYSGLGMSSAFEEKGNKYFDYVDNLLGKTWGSKKNLIFAEGNKYILKKTEDMKILSQTQQKFMEGYLTKADEWVPIFLDLIFSSVIKNPQDKERLLKYFQKKTKNFSYSYLMENTIQPTYYDYFWSSSSNASILWSSLPYFSATFKNGIDKSAHPFYRLSFMKGTSRGDFTSGVNMQSTLAKVNTNHYFNGVWGKYFSTQNRNIMGYADVYAPYQKYSKIFSNEDIAWKTFAYVNGGERRFKTNDLKDINISPLSTLSYNGNNFYLLGDYIDNYKKNQLSTTRKHQYQFFAYRMNQFFRNFDIDAQKIATANNLMSMGFQYIKSLFTVQSNQVSDLFQNLFTLIMNQSSYWFDSMGAELENLNANDTNANSSNRNQVKSWTDKAMQARVKDAWDYASTANTINDLLGIENGLNAYFDLQVNSLQEGTFFSKVFKWEPISEGEIKAFYEVYYDKNKVQEKILNYLQNVTTKERYDKIYALALDEAVKTDDKETGVFDSLTQKILNAKRQNNNHLKEYYIPKMKNYSDSLIWWWSNQDVKTTKGNLDKIKQEYEEYLNNKDFKIPETFIAFAEEKSIPKDKIKLEYGAYLKNTLSKLEVAYLKQFSHKTFTTQYMEMIANNLYINPITSLFKKLPEKEQMDFTQEKGELAMLEKVFNSFLIYSNLWNSVESSPVFHVEEDTNKLVKPLVKLFNPSLSYVLKNLVDKGLVEINLWVGNETVNEGKLSHNYTTFGESYGRVWLYNAMTAIKSDLITTNFVKLMQKYKAVLDKPYKNNLLVESFFAKEKNLYQIVRSFMPYYMVLPPEIWAVGAFSSSDVDNLIEKRIEFANTKYTNANQKMKEKIQKGNYSYKSFMREADIKLAWTTLDSDLLLNNNEIVSMEGIDQFYALPNYSEKQIVNIGKEIWGNLPNDANLLQAFLRTNFYKKLAWISKYISPVVYDESSKKFTYNEAFHSTLWNAISEGDEKKFDLAKALKWESATTTLLDWVTQNIAKVELPSFASRGWISRYSDLNNQWMVTQVKAGTVGTFQDNLPMYALLTSYWLEHIPFYQHHYLTTLLKLKLQDQTSNPWTFFKVGTDNVLNVLSDSLTKKTYQKDIENYINTHIKRKKGNLTSEEMKNKWVKKFTASSDAKSLGRYYNSIISYEVGKAKLLQDTIDLWKEYNTAVDWANKDIFSVAYPSAKVQKNKKEAYENIIDTTLWYYERQANQLLMSLWGSYYFQRFNMSSSYLASAKENLSKLSVSDVLKGTLYQMIQDVSPIGVSYGAWVAQPLKTNANMIKTFEKSLSLELLRNDVKTRGWWFFRDEDKKEDPKALFSYLKSYHLQTGFYTYLLMLREIIEPDVFQRHDLAKEQTVEIWATVGKHKTTEEQKARTYLELWLISAYEYFIMANPSGEGWEWVSFKDVGHAMGIETQATTYQEFRDTVKKNIEKRFAQTAKLIDGLLFTITMNDNYQDVNIADAKIMNASNLWLKDYTELLWEPMVVNDLIMFLYWADYLQAMQETTSQSNFINEIKQEVVKNPKEDIGSIALRIVKEETPDLEKGDKENITKASMKLMKNTPFMKWLAYYSLYSYDNLNINYNLYYQDYIKKYAQEDGYHYFNTALTQKKSAAKAALGGVWDLGVWTVDAFFNSVGQAFWNTLNYFGVSEVKTTIETIDTITNEFVNPKGKTISGGWSDDRHWVDLGNTLSFSNMISDVGTMLFAQGWRFDQDFRGKDLKILTEYIRLNDYIKYLYSTWGKHDFLDWLRSTVNVNQITEEMIENSYTLWENLQTNNFALLNYILSNEKYQATHIYPWDSLEKWNELNKLNVIAFNYFSYEEDKDSILSASEVLDALKSWGLADWVDVSKIEWEWFVDGLKYIECKSSSQCESMIREVKALPWWTAFDAYIKNKIESIEKWNKDKNLDKKQKKVVEDTISALKDLVGSIISQKINTENIKGWEVPVWDIVGFWETEKASCKQKFPNTSSKEFWTCMSDAIIASDAGRTAAKNQGVLFHGQCVWGSNIFRAWSNPDTKSVAYSGNWHLQVKSMTRVVSDITAVQKNWLGSFSVNGIPWYWSALDNWLRYCAIAVNDFKKYVPNMIFSSAPTATNRAGHTGYVVNVENCDKENTCKIFTLETNTLQKWYNGGKCEAKDCYNGGALKWTPAYPYKFIAGYYNKSFQRLINKWYTWFADLNRPYNYGMVQKLYGKVTQDSINKFCADYDNNIKQFK